MMNWDEEEIARDAEALKMPWADRSEMEVLEAAYPAVDNAFNAARGAWNPEMAETVAIAHLEGAKPASVRLWHYIAEYKMSENGKRVFKASRLLEATDPRDLPLIIATMPEGRVREFLCGYLGGI